MKKRRYEVYIGLGNQDREIVKKAAIDYYKSEKIDFSIEDISGGYVYNNKQYITENGLRLIFFGDYAKEVINELADYIKTNYTQESVLIDYKDLEVSYE